MAGRSGRLVPLSLILWSGWACSSTTEYDPFLVKPEVLHADVQTVVLTPVQLPPDLDIPERILLRLDSLIGTTVRTAGFTTVASHDFSEIWDRVQLEVGGLFDPRTGERDELRFADARELLAWELEDRFGADALLYADLVVVSAPFANGVAHWDETSQPLTGWGWRLLDALNALLGEEGGSLPEGTVPALSLSVTLERVSGEQLYANAGGIEVLEKVGTSESDRTPVPQEKLCRNWRRNRKAVEIALGPLTAHVREHRPPAR